MFLFSVPYKEERLYQFSLQEYVLINLRDFLFFPEIEKLYLLHNILITLSPDIGLNLGKFSLPYLETSNAVIIGKLSLICGNSSR